MKKILYLVPLIIVFISCTDGSVKYKLRFTTEDIGVVRSTDTIYTQFGDYITSLTPSKFTANIWSLGYLDRVMVPGTNQANSLEYINQQDGSPGCLKPANDPRRYVDFSANTTLEIIPGIGGDVNQDNNTFNADQVDFIYFYFIPYYWYQEVTLPAGYTGITIEMFQNNGQDSAIIESGVLKVQHKQMMKKIFPNAVMDQYVQFIFGNCDSTYVVNPNGEGISLGSDSPLMNVVEHNLTIRSNLYDKITLNKPQSGEQITMVGALSINTTNIIQIYAGADNIPYTNDDVFVYAPNFWERITARLVLE